MVFAAICKVLKPVAAVFVLALPAALGLPSTRAAANVDGIGSCSGQNLILPFADVPGGSLFDGERILVAGTSKNLDGSSVSVWKASTLAPVGAVSLGDFTAPGVASDGLHFWISLNSGGGGYLARF